MEALHRLFPIDPGRLPRMGAHSDTGAVTHRGAVSVRRGRQRTLRSFDCQIGGVVMEHAFGWDIPRSLEEICRPDRLALLVYDMQAGIVVQLPDGAEVVRRVLDVVDAARAGGFCVFYT